MSKHTTSKLGYLAMPMQGGHRPVHLTQPTHPRKQLLTALGRKHCSKVYCDLATGGNRHVGYIVGGVCYEVYEVHSWASTRS